MRIFFRMVATMVVLFAVTTIQAQDVNDAGNIKNEGVKQYKAMNYDDAIKEFKTCIEMCDVIGIDADEIKASAEKSLIASYFGNSKKLAKSKDYAGAYAMLDLMKAESDKVGDAKNANIAVKVKPNFQVGEALSLIKAGNYDGAVKVANAAIAGNPRFYKSYYALGLAYQKKGNLLKMKDNYDKAIAKGATSSKAAKTLKAARTSGSVAFFNAATVLIQEGQFGKAKEDIKHGLSYDKTSVDGHYYLALANNGLKAWDEAIAAANVAIEGAKGEKSKYYFELGKAYEGKGDATAACTSYKKVIQGPNVEAAKFQLENVLKCG